MEDVEKWSDSGSILKVALAGFGKKNGRVVCEKRNSRARLRFWLRNERTKKRFTEKIKTVGGTHLERERGEGQELGFERESIE